MKTDLPIKNGIVIPEYELEITASRASGPGGQHINKTDSRITVRWNVMHSVALNEDQRARALFNLQSRLTVDGDLIVHNSESRSQIQNKKLALQNLADEIRRALYIPKKRKPTQVTKSAKESQLRTKMQRSTVKKGRSEKISED